MPQLECALPEKITEELAANLSSKCLFRERSMPAMQAYQNAIKRVVSSKRATAGAAHVLDLGAGSGLLSLMAATAGADTVVACDLHESMTTVARQVPLSYSFVDVQQLTWCCEAKLCAA